MYYFVFVDKKKNKTKNKHETNERERKKYREILMKMKGDRKIKFGAMPVKNSTATDLHSFTRIRNYIIAYRIDSNERRVK